MTELAPIVRALSGLPPCSTQAATPSRSFSTAHSRSRSGEMKFGRPRLIVMPATSASRIPLSASISCQVTASGALITTLSPFAAALAARAAIILPLPVPVAASANTIFPFSAPAALCSSSGNKTSRTLSWPGIPKAAFTGAGSHVAP